MRLIGIDIQPGKGAYEGIQNPHPMATICLRVLKQGNIQGGNGCRGRSCLGSVQELLK